MSGDNSRKKKGLMPEEIKQIASLTLDVDPSEYASVIKAVMEYLSSGVRHCCLNSFQILNSISWKIKNKINYPQWLDNLITFDEEMKKYLLANPIVQCFQGVTESDVGKIVQLLDGFEEKRWYPESLLDFRFAVGPESWKRLSGAERERLRDEFILILSWDGFVS